MVQGTSDATELPIVLSLADSLYPGAPKRIVLGIGGATAGERRYRDVSPVSRAGLEQIALWIQLTLLKGETIACLPDME